MAGLRDVVQRLAARDDVDAVVVVSSDGLPIDHAGRAAVDPEAIAALAATFANGARRLGQVADCAGLNGSVVEFSDRLAVIRPLGAEGHLFVLGAARPTSASCCSISGATGRPSPPCSEPTPPMRWAVILAGGSGSRFWPLSTPTSPKQLLPLVGSESTAEQAVTRLEGLVPRERILIVTGPALAPRLQAALGLAPENVLVEPRAASTGPALVWATVEARRRDPAAEVLSVHADWTIREADAFRHTAALALSTAVRHRRLVTVGIVPTRPDTGFGYIVPGAALDEVARTVSRFAEKPSAATALDLMASGALWNSGLFAWAADVLLEEVGRHTDEIAPHLARLERGDVAGFFQAVTAVSIDVGLLERSAAVAVVPGRFTWDDVGTWDALPRVRARDGQGNVAVGPVYLVDSDDCVVWSAGDPVVVSGVKDMVVVHANGRILVMPRRQAADLKAILDRLPAEVRDLP
jgi:mannose-1-phosphate guanylyltransferase